MKLVEILAHHLNEWPDHVAAMAQDRDGDVQNYRDTTQIYFEAGLACGSSRILGEYSLYGAELASDHSTAIITRADWEAERARIKGESKVKPKANKDGWIRHQGGKCPVEAGTLVDVRYRDGEIKYGLPANENAKGYRRDAGPAFFMHDNKENDIMAWRPHKVEHEPKAGRLVTGDAVLEFGFTGEGEAQMPAAKYFDGPLQWRDRIHAIDFEKKTHEAAMAALDSERAELVAKLKVEGFVLIQSDEPNGVVESAQQNIAQQDMSDWRNWEKGDILLCVKAYCYPSELTVGRLYPYHGDGDVIDDGGAEQGYPIRFGECFKWHSRPSN